MAQEFTTRLQAVCGEKDIKILTASLTAIQDDLVKQKAGVAAFRELVSKLVSDDVPPQASRPVLLHLTQSIVKLPADTFVEVANFGIQSIRQHPSAGHDEADYVLRDLLFNHYSVEQDFKSAAMVLSSLNMENTSKAWSVDDKADIYVKVAETFLADDESSADQAEIFVQKASALMNDVSSTTQGKVIHLRYKTTHARVLDANRKFVDAAMRYFELSITPRETVELLNLNLDDLLEFLGKAVTCVVLGKAGPQRSRVLGVLYKDDRLRQLELMPKYATHASILTKMYAEQLLRRDEFTAFEDSLAEHQRAQTADGFTFPEKAIIEHNMLAAGRLYDNIHFNELGSILRLDAAKAERVAARMIVEDRLKATIDQTDGVLVFHNDDDALLSWDERIRGACGDLVELVEMVQGKQ